MLVFRYNVLYVLLFVVISNCGTASEFEGVRGMKVSRVGVSAYSCGTGGRVFDEGSVNFAYRFVCLQSAEGIWGDQSGP